MAVEQEDRLFFKQVFGGAWITQGIGVAAELGIADLLAVRPYAIDELAKVTNTHRDSLYRVLRALASVGVFAQDEEERFVLTPLAGLLRTDADMSQRSLGMMMGAEFHEAWGELLYSVRSGEPGFEKRFGVPFFQYMTDHPLRHSVYDSAMGAFGKGEIGPFLDAYDLTGIESVVDIGGGSGVFLAAILNRYPGIRGTLFDLPAVAERLRSAISPHFSASGRFRIEGGDFFASVPEGADAYVLQHIIHDWEDADAVKILDNCRVAMNPGGRLLVLEMVIPPGNEPGFGKWLDLMMLLVGGRERTEAEYGRLFEAAGLKLNRVLSTSSEVSVLEAIPA